MGTRTPAETLVTADQIPSYRAKREKTKFQACTQVNQIFLKANGNISCSCIRYWNILGNAKEVNVGEFANGELMTYIRESFRDGYEPFDFCAGCISRLSTYKVEMVTPAISLHIEPS